MSRTAQRYRLLKGSHQALLAEAWGNNPVDRALEMLREGRERTPADQPAIVANAMQAIWRDA